MDLLGMGNNDENSSENKGFSGKIEQLKDSITKLVNTSTEKKQGNVDKVNSIKTKIIEIKESVANILSVKDQFATTSELLKKANAEVAKCQADLLEKGKELEELKGQLAAKDTENDLVSGDYEKQLANQKTQHETAIKEKEDEIEKLNEQLQNNIAEVSSITEQIDKGMQTIGDDGEELGTALTELENEVNGLQLSMKTTEKTIDDNKEVQAETVPVAAVESGNAPENDETASIESGQTSLPDESSVGSEPSVGEREQLIRNLKKEGTKLLKESTEAGNFDLYLKFQEEAAQKLYNFDLEQKEKGIGKHKSGPLPHKNKYKKELNFQGGGSKKNKSTRKKRKAKKTQKRKKRSSRK